MKSSVIKQLASEQDMLAFGAQFANAVTEGAVIYLFGTLGAGKTTFTRGFLQGLGYQHKVKSPTYTLVEPYEVSGRTVFHFDLYRIEQAAQLEHIGIHEYFTPTSICLIEWPEKGFPLLPNPDLTLYISMAGEGREVRIEPHSERAQAIVSRLNQV